MLQPNNQFKMLVSSDFIDYSTSFFENSKNRPWMCYALE